AKIGESSHGLSPIFYFLRLNSQKHQIPRAEFLYEHFQSHIGLLFFLLGVFGQWCASASARSRCSSLRASKRRLRRKRLDQIRSALRKTHTSPSGNSQALVPPRSFSSGTRPARSRPRDLPKSPRRWRACSLHRIFHRRCLRSEKRIGEGFRAPRQSCSSRLQQAGAALHRSVSCVSAL